MFLSKRGKLEVYADRNQRVEDVKPKEPPQLVSSAHHEDFLDAIRSGRKPTAEIQIGHDSVALVHLANISVRLGRSLRIDLATEEKAGGGLEPKLIELAIAIRKDLRDEMNFAMADKIRDGLLKAGIEIRDGKDGTTWKKKTS